MCVMCDTQEMALQTATFVDLHQEYLVGVLRDRSPVLSMPVLQEMHLVVSIFYHLAGHDAAVSEKTG